VDKKKILSLKKLQYDYDKISDVLYVSFGKPRKAICRETDDGVLIRLDPFTDKCVGITVVDFKEKFFKSSRLNIKRFLSNNLPQIISSI
jgi:uncharacterized protein YuzE